MLELAELIRAATGSDSRIELVPYAQAYEPGFEDMRRRAPDVALLREPHRLGARDDDRDDDPPDRGVDPGGEDAERRRRTVGLLTGGTS